MVQMMHWAGAILATLCLSVPAASVTRVATDSDHDGLSNVFETTWSHTDPTRADTNHDGLLDPAEDPDGDGLSNLGEQRFHTDPLVADSDADGIPDGRDDANHNGRRDALEQDRRPVPNFLHPALGKAKADYMGRCHSSAYDANIHPCVYGVAASRTTIALFGDSHALQWLPALARAGAQRSWRVVSITKSGCPSVDVTFLEPFFAGAGRSCRAWRTQGEGWIARHRPDVVIVANSGGYAITDPSGHRLRRAKAQARWKSGLLKTLTAIPNRSRVVVLGDTPHMERDVPPCLSGARFISSCVTPRGKALAPAHDAVERTAAFSKGDQFVSPNRLVCPYDPCPVIIGDLLLWRDKSHLTATYARQLAPFLGEIVRAALPVARIAAPPDSLLFRTSLYGPTISNVSPTTAGGDRRSTPRSALDIALAASLLSRPPAGAATAPLHRPAGPPPGAST